MKVELALLAFAVLEGVRAVWAWLSGPRPEEREDRLSDKWLRDLARRE